MRKKTLYGKSRIRPTYVSCKVQSIVHTVYCLLRPSQQLQVTLCVQTRHLRSENGIRDNKERPRFHVGTGGGVVQR